MEKEQSISQLCRELITLVKECYDQCVKENQQREQRWTQEEEIELEATQASNEDELQHNIKNHQTDSMLFWTDAKERRGNKYQREGPKKGRRMDNELEKMKRGRRVGSLLIKIIKNFKRKKKRNKRREGRYGIKRKKEKKKLRLMRWNIKENG